MSAEKKIVSVDEPDSFPPERRRDMDARIEKLKDKVDQIWNGVEDYRTDRQKRIAALADQGRMHDRNIDGLDEGLVGVARRVETLEFRLDNAYRPKHDEVEALRARVKELETQFGLALEQNFDATRTNSEIWVRCAAFGLRSNIAIHRHGGLLAAKARVLGPEFALKRGQVVVPDLLAGRIKSLRAEGASLGSISREVKFSPKIVARVLREKG